MIFLSSAKNLIAFQSSSKNNFNLKENIYSQLCYTELLNECKFKHTSNADKVKENGLNNCTVI